MPDEHEGQSNVLDSRPRPKDFVAGIFSPLPDDVELETGDHTPFIAQPHEMQLRFGHDYAACTDFAALDVIENIIFRKFGVRVNYSERWLAITSELTQNGNSLWNVAEAIRKYGLVPEEMLPWTAEEDTFEKFVYVGPEKRDECLATGKKWLEEYFFGWEWTYDDFGHGHEWALKRSPLYAASLYASEAGKDPVTGIYKTQLPNSPLTTHAIGFLHQTPEKLKDIDDSYATQLKRLASDFRIPIAQRFYIAKRKPDPIPMYYPPKNSLVAVVDSGERLMYVEGDKIFKDDAGKILLEVTARNAGPDAMSRDFPVAHVKAADIAHLKRVNLKGEPV
jgi:hypothetical protein